MSEQEQQYYRNLLDAGCSDKKAQECIRYLQTGKNDALLKKLAEHRNTLLDNLHTSQSQIDCLDYFVYQIRK